MMGEATLALAEQGMCAAGAQVCWHSVRAMLPGILHANPLAASPEAPAGCRDPEAASGLHPRGFLSTSAVPFYLFSSTRSQSAAHSLAINTAPGPKAGSVQQKEPSWLRTTAGAGWGGQGCFAGQPVGSFEICPALLAPLPPPPSGFPPARFLLGAVSRGAAALCLPGEETPLA